MKQFASSTRQLASSTRQAQLHRFFPSFQNRASVIGLPTSIGQPLPGVERGPEALREAGLMKELHQLGWIVEDHGDVDIQRLPNLDDESGGVKIKHARQVGETNRQIHQAVYEQAKKKNSFGLYVGGDHSVAIGTVSAVMRAYPDVCVIWVDAHADINTPTTSVSGNTHGMPVAFLKNINNARDIEGFEWMREFPTLDANSVALVGLRDVDDGEKDLLRDNRVMAHSMYDFDHHGARRIMDSVLHALDPLDTRPIHLSFDIDGCEPSIAPATGTRVRGGLSFREACYIAERVVSTGRLVSMDMVEINPALASTPEALDTTTNTAISIVKSAMGDFCLL